MQETGCAGCNGNHDGRRDFIRVGALSFLGIHLSQLLEAQQQIAAVEGTVAKAKAQACILLWLDGGCSQMDSWDPKPSSSFKPISSNVAGIEISELFPKLARHMDKLAIIRTMYIPENNHPQATHYVATGHQPNQAMQFPSFSSVIAKEMDLRNNIPPHIMVPEMPKGRQYVEYFRAHFLGAQYDPMVLPDPSDKDFKVPDLTLPKNVTLAKLESRQSLLDLVDRRYREKITHAEHTNLDTFRRQASTMIFSESVRNAFDLSKELEKTKDAYGRYSFGQSALMARRLVEAGSRFVTANGYERQAWDTHSSNDKSMKENLAPTLDQTFSTLLDDLSQRGLLESTVVIAMGEFGRTYDLNSNGGRDHWGDCWSVLVGGGGIRGGQVVGTSDNKGAYPTDRRVTMGDFFATIYKAFGIDWHKEYMHPIGRPLKIANSLDDETGIPIQELAG